MSARTAARRVAFGGVLLALALVLSYVEHLIPLGTAIPGVKLGLANIAALLILRREGLLPALTLQTARVALANLLFGSLTGFAYGLCGGVLSLCVAAALCRTGRFGLVGVSAAGGAAHNLGQLCVAALMMGSGAVFSYVPILLLAGTACGVLTGIAGAALERAFPPEQKKGEPRK